MPDPESLSERIERLKALARSAPNAMGDLSRSGNVLPRQTREYFAAFGPGTALQLMMELECRLEAHAAVEDLVEQLDNCEAEREEARQAVMELSLRLPLHVSLKEFEETKAEVESLRDDAAGLANVMCGTCRVDDGRVYAFCPCCRTER